MLNSLILDKLDILQSPLSSFYANGLVNVLLNFQVVFVSYKKDSLGDSLCVSVPNRGDGFFGGYYSQQRT